MGRWGGGEGSGRGGEGVRDDVGRGGDGGIINFETQSAKRAPRNRRLDATE